jgi:hypothetical protein
VKKGLYITLGVVAFLALLVYLTIGGERYRVEVCMEFQGKQSCRIASGTTKEQALRTASENACAIIASGMTDSMACDRSTPTRITWQ